MAGETFFDNFNNDPASISLETTSYTIPSGGYARIRVSDFSTDFKIDSNIVVENTNQNVSGTLSGTSVRYTNDTNNVVMGHIILTGGSLTGVVSVVPSSDLSSILDNPYTAASMTMSAIGILSVVIPPGARIYNTGNSPGTNININIGNMSSDNAMEFWVPEGTLVEGTKFIVELYNKQGA